MRNRQMWTAVFLVMLLLLGVVLWNENRDRRSRLPFSQLVTLVEGHQVRSLTVKGARLTAERTDGVKVESTGPENLDFYLERFAADGLVPDFEDAGDAVWVNLLLTGAPLLIMVAFLMHFMRQLQPNSGRALGFGKSRARPLTENHRRVTFADVASCEEAKTELTEIVEFLRDPRKFNRLGGRIPKGVLLMGSPGTGKTLLARAVAGEAGVPFFSLSGSEFVEMFVGVGASRVRDLFEQAKRQAPCIVFIDEIDAVGRQRGGGPGGGQDEREQTLNQLLVEMDGFESHDGVILVAATNRADVLDPALLRPGRFDRRVMVPHPDLRGRIAILGVHARRVSLDDRANLESLARGTAGFSGADLESLVNEAALLAARRNKRRVEQADLEDAKDKVAMGAERRSLVLSDDVKKRIAYHEAGHAIVARLLPETDPVDKITIVPRSMAAGRTQFLPAEERHDYSRERLSSFLALSMGGRAAEELVFRHYDTGAASDIRQATRVAHAMVCQYGMSEDLGPVAWGEVSDDPFGIGGPARPHHPYSEATAQRIDAEVLRLVTEGYERARAILVQNSHILHQVARELLERETLDGREFERVVGELGPIHPRSAAI